MQFVGILNIHHLVAYIISSFHQINQWITGKVKRIVFETPDAKIIGNAAVILLLGSKETKLILP